MKTFTLTRARRCVSVATAPRANRGAPQAVQNREKKGGARRRAVPKMEKDVAGLVEAVGESQSTQRSLNNGIEMSVVRMSMLIKTPIGYL